MIFDIFYLILISLLRIKQRHASIKKVSSWRTFHKLSTTNESTRNFTKTEQVLVTFLFLFSTVWLCKHVFKKMSLSHSFIRSTAFIKTFYHLGLFEKWSTLDPKTFYAIPFQKLVFLISFYLEVLGKRQRNKKKLIFGQLSLFLFRLPC